MVANLWRGARALAGFLRSRAFALSLLALAAAFVVFQIVDRTNAVYVVDGQRRSLTFTMAAAPAQLLQAAGVAGEAPAPVLDGHFAQVNLE